MLTGHITVDGKVKDIDLISVLKLSAGSSQEMTEAGNWREMEELACPGAAAAPGCSPRTRELPDGSDGHGFTG